MAIAASGWSESEVMRAHGLDHMGWLAAEGRCGAHPEARAGTLRDEPK